MSRPTLVTRRTLDLFRAERQQLVARIPAHFLSANPAIAVLYGDNLERFLDAGAQHTLQVLEEAMLRGSVRILERMMAWTARMLPRYRVLPTHLLLFWQGVQELVNARLDPPAVAEIQPFLDFALTKQAELVRQYELDRNGLPDWRVESVLPGQVEPLPLSDLVRIMYRWPGFERILDRLPRQPQDVKELYYFGLVSILLEEERCRVLRSSFEGDLAYLLVELMTGEIFRVPHALVDEEFERDVKSQVRLLMAAP